MEVVLERVPNSEYGLRHRRYEGRDKGISNTEDRMFEDHCKQNK